MDNDGMVLSQNLCFLVAESLYQWPLVLRPLLAAVSYLPINPIVNMLNNAVAVVEFRKNNPEVSGEKPSHVSRPQADTNAGA